MRQAVDGWVGEADDSDSAVDSVVSAPSVTSDTVYDSGNVSPESTTRAVPTATVCGGRMIALPFALVIETRTPVAFESTAGVQVMIA